jgi:hypothetical protein
MRVKQRDLDNRPHPVRAAIPNRNRRRQYRVQDRNRWDRSIRTGQGFVQAIAKKQQIPSILSNIRQCVRMSAATIRLRAEPA